MLSKPVLAKTDDREKRAQINSYCGDPEGWFDSRYFRDQGIYATSFDFLVNWEDEKVCDEVWMKRISNSDDIHSKTKEQLMQLITDCDGNEKTSRLYGFLRSQGMTGKYMLFRDVPEQDWHSRKEKIVEVELAGSGAGAVSSYNAVEIQEKIRRLRRTPASIGKHGLVYSTSTLEGYLSKQHYFWPGDADTVLYDDKNNVAAVLEFKKHTASSKKPFKDQRLSNYLEDDILKYKSLALLRDRFKTALYVIYYPIPTDIRYIIVEKIEGTPDNLRAVNRWEIKLPDQSKTEDMAAFAKEFMTRVVNGR